MRSIAIALALLCFTAAPSWAQAVWDCVGLDCQNLVARTGDTFDATNANSSIPGPVESSAPTCATEGQVYFDSVDHFLHCCDGSSWAQCGTVTTDTNAGTICSAGEFLNGDTTCDPVVVDTGPSPDCSGTLTYQDGDAGCDTYTLSGSTAELATVVSKTSGMCAEWDASGNLVADAAACNSGGGGSPGFDTITNGTNTAATAMVVGNTATLSPSGTGTITANRTACAATTEFMGGGTSAPTCYAETLYPRLLGRAGGQTLIGGTASGEDLTLESTSHATVGTIFLEDLTDTYSTIPDVSSGTVSALQFSAAVDQTGGLLWPWLLSGTTALSGVGSQYASIRLERKIEVGASASTLVNMYDLWSYLDIEVTSTSGALLFLDAGTFLGNSRSSSNVASTAPQVNMNVFSGRSLLEYKPSTGTATGGAVLNMFSSYPLVQVSDATSGTASYTATEVTDLEILPVRLDANHANKTTVLTLRRGIHFEGGLTRGGGGLDSSPGTETLTEQRAIQIDYDVDATTNRGIINGMSTEYPPQAEVIAAGTTLAAPESTMINITSSGSVTWAGGGTLISDGQDGQCVILMNADTADTITLTDGNNVGLPGQANLALAPDEAVQLCWTTTTSEWIAVDTQAAGGGGGTHGGTGNRTCIGGSNFDTANNFSCKGTSGTAASVDWVPREALTVSSFYCQQNGTDGSCAPSLQIAKNGTATGGTCTLSGETGCEVTGLSVSANGSSDGLTIKATGGSANCSSGLLCILEFDYD